VLFGAGVTSLAACARPSQRNELVIWHAYRGREAEALLAAIDLYHQRKSASEARVRAVPIPFDAFADKISATIPRGKGPDLFIFAHERLGGWVEGGLTVEPIGFWVTEAMRSQCLPGLFEALTYKGEVFGLPLSFKSVALIYNRGLSPDPPRTTADLVIQAAALTDTPSGRYGLAYTFDDFFYHAALQNGFGGGVLDANGAPILNHPSNIEAANLMLRWKNSAPRMPDEPSFALIQSLFNQGRAAMTISGPWFLGEVNKSIDVAVAPLPLLSEARGAPIRPWLAIEGIFISPGSPRTEEAFRFASFLCGEEAGLLLARDGGQLHANRAIYEDATMRSNAIATAFRTQLETATPMPNIPEMTPIWSPADKAMKRIVKGESSPEAAWNKAQAEVVEAIAALRDPA
jgi:arabinogalactan oligomer/maltooligosaccharide transport system substrate-binding protein